MSSSKLRICILWRGYSDYFFNLILSLIPHVDKVLVCFCSSSKYAPYELPNKLAHQIEILHFEGVERIDFNILQSEVERLDPSMIIYSGWDIIPYVRLARQYRRHARNILCFDRQWIASPKQILGCLISPYLIKRYYDIAFVPGNRQALLAYKLGFHSSDVFTGMYAGNSCLADDVLNDFSYHEKLNRFAFVGRLVDDKGVATLAKAWNIFKSTLADQQLYENWQLHVFGAGQLKPLLAGLDDVILHGFTDQRTMFQELVKCRCLVVPSYKEPWGVQIHEGASLGLPLIVTSACGSGDHLVRQGVNGYIIPPYNHIELAQALLSMATCDCHESMSLCSLQFSLNYNPSLWSATILAMYNRLICKPLCI